MKLTTNPIKGARDFFPKDKLIQRYMFDTIRRICESYGYEEYDAPILESTELYLNKGNEEIINEQTYTFNDRADRSVTLRTEMTPSVARMVASRRQEIALPARWYSIPQCWRYERMQKGRGREFYQLNVDIFGLPGFEAEVEIISLANNLLKAFGAKPEMYTIRVNSRKALNELLEMSGFDTDTSNRIIKLLDRVNKPSFDKLLNEFDDKTRPKVSKFISETTEADILKTQAGANLAILIESLRETGITVETDIKISRGFDYYTDIVFEVFDNNPDNNRSMFGGGRYDNLLSMFDVEPLPAVGFGMGDITLLNFLTDNQLLPNINSNIDLYVVLVGDANKGAQEVVGKLRDSGLNVATDLTKRKIEKQIKSADKKGISQVLFIGDDELKTGIFKLKNIRTGDEQKLNIEELMNFFKK